MTGLVRLPSKPVHGVLISGEYQQLEEAFARSGIKAVTTERDFRLPDPVAWHPDMQVCVMGGRQIAIKGSLVQSALKSWDIKCMETLEEPGKKYPRDALCNVLSWGRWAIGNVCSVDKNITKMVKRLGLQWLQVRQGYAACSTALVDNTSAMTADAGIAQALKAAGMDVLMLAPGGIRLPGYQYGFIGGCCGKLAPDQMAFAGSLDSHPEGKRIWSFLRSRDIHVMELWKGELWDVGGIIPLERD